MDAYKHNIVHSLTNKRPSHTVTVQHMGDRVGALAG